MNPNFNQTVTIYNCLKSKDTEDHKAQWWKKTLHNCSWTGDIKTGQKERTDQTKTPETVVRIPIQTDLEYLPYTEWKNNPSASFTLNPGDVVILGECDDEITGISPDTASEFIQKHSECFMIQLVKDNTRCLGFKHLKASTNWSKA